MTAPRDKIGIAFGNPDTTGPLRYGSKALAAMNHMGLNRARIASPLVDASDSWGKLYLPLLKGGVRMLFTLRDAKDWKKHVGEVAKVAAAFPGQVIGMEGPNEPDLNPVTFNGKTDKRRVGSSWPKASAAQALALMQAQRNEIRANPLLQSPIKVVAFNDWFLKEQAAFTSVGNTHIYPRGTDLKGSGQVPPLLTQNPNGLMITELGYTQGSGSAFGQVTEQQQAERLAADIAYAMATPKIDSLFIYNMVDFNSASSDQQDRFGLHHSDWSRKPAADAVRKAVLG